MLIWTKSANGNATKVYAYIDGWNLHVKVCVCGSNSRGIIHLCNARRGQAKGVHSAEWVLCARGADII